MIRVAIADDHVLLLEGLAQALQAIPDLQVVETTADGAGLLTSLDDTRPDVVLVDLEMPGLDGLGVLAELPDGLPAVVVTMHADQEHRRRAMEAGAAAFLSKSTPLPQLAAAIRAVADGRRLPDEDALRGTLNDYAEPRLDPGAAALTARERELLGLLAQGVSSTEELAELLFISTKTVKNHLASIYEKLAVSDRAQAAVEAIRLGITGRK